MPAQRRTDARLNSRNSQVRGNRQASNRGVKDKRELSDDERVDEFRKQLFQSVLPDIPPIPGWHVCWLTTDNPRDSIQARRRLGYEPILPEDIPGWGYNTLKSGTYEGCIGINEMVAFKLPLHLYEAYMRENHHNAPLEQEDLLVNATRMAEAEASQMAREDVSFMEEDGMADLGNAPDAPSFAETLGESV